MYEHTAIAECPCTTGTDCRRLNCFCSGFCGLYEGEVAEFKSYTAATISPDPRTIDDYDSSHNDWLDWFTKLLPTLHDCIIVLELAGVRPHYHCLFKVKDRVGFNIKLLNRSRYHNVKTHNMFKDGLHYLFKDVDNTYKGTGIIPIVLYDDLQRRHAYNKEYKKRSMITHKINLIDEPKTPIWMKSNSTMFD